MYLCRFFCSSIGKKIIVSLTGLFLVIFLLVHLSLNLLTLVGDGHVFDIASHFMATNVVMKVLEIVLALGFIIHIIYTSYITLKNQFARPVKYDVVNQSEASSWSSRNMYITGGMVFIFLIIHLFNYYYKIKFTDLIESKKMTEFTLVTRIFHPDYWYYLVIYITGFILLGLHLNHSFQSGFQTLGLNNRQWLPRLKVIGSIYALIIVVGFTIIPLYFFISALIK
jgi:succinate dehydrogenase / fumarate reductase, cytochrome b subunit